MSRVLRIRCDQCNRELPSGHPDLAHWYEVIRRDPRDFAEVGNSDCYDFCSTACVSAWATSRELVGTS